MKKITLFMVLTLLIIGFTPAYSSSTPETAVVEYPAILNIEAGPIFSHEQAQLKCQAAYEKHKQLLPANVEARWTGQWHTTKPGEMSVCGIKIIDKRDWQPTPISSRPFVLTDIFDRCNYGYTFDTLCAKDNKLSNCWIYDDLCRDKLNMKTSELACEGNSKCVYIINANKLPAQIEDGRYIYVLRKGDSTPLTIVMRKFDRNFTLKNGKKCIFEKYQYRGNVEAIKTPGLSPHVRHSQLNSGWSPVWGAGELIVIQGQVTIISNESGHFKPANKTLQYVQKALYYLDIGHNVNTMDATSDSISNLDEEFSCMNGEIRNK